MLDIQWVFAFLALGLLVGFMAGLLGIGGGGIMVPVLTTIFLLQGVKPDTVVHLALGTSMATIIFTSFASMRAHHKKQGVIWPIFSKMSLGVILGTFIATFFAAQLSSLYLAIFFTVFMSFIALKMFQNKTPVAHKKLPNTLGLFMVGGGIGAISALVSIGGGSLTVPYLAFRNIDIKKAIGTSAAVGLPISISGALGYLFNGWDNTVVNELTFGFIYLPAVLLIATTSFISAPFGVKMAHHLPVGVLKKIFALLLILLSAKMLFSII